MAAIRVTQQFVEIIRGDTSRPVPRIFVTQQYVENIRGDTARIEPGIRVSQQYVEIIRSVEAVTFRPKGSIF